MAERDSGKVGARVDWREVARLVGVVEHVPEQGAQVVGVQSLPLPW